MNIKHNNATFSPYLGYATPNIQVWEISTSNLIPSIHHELRGLSSSQHLHSYTLMSTISVSTAIGQELINKNF